MKIIMLLHPLLQVTLLSIAKLSAQQQPAQITPERPLRLALRACTSQMEPFQLDTMLVFFIENGLVFAIIAVFPSGFENLCFCGVQQGSECVGP